MKINKELQNIINDEVQGEIDTLDNMSMYGIVQGGYSRREQCAYIDGLKGFDLDFETRQEREAYKIGLDRRSEIIEDYRLSKLDK